MSSQPSHVARDQLPIFTGDDNTPDVIRFCSTFELRLNSAKDAPTAAAKQIAIIGGQCLQGPALDWWHARVAGKSYYTGKNNPRVAGSSG